MHVHCVLLCVCIMIIIRVSIFLELIAVLLQLASVPQAQDLCNEALALFKGTPEEVQTCFNSLNYTSVRMAVLLWQCLLCCYISLHVIIVP
jgi:hypothetical protein